MKITSFDEYYNVEFDKRQKILSDKNFLANNVSTLTAEGSYGVLFEMKLHNVDKNTISFFENKRNEYIDDLFTKPEELKTIPYEELKNLIAERFFKDVPLNLNINLNVLNALANDDKNIKKNNLIPYLENWQAILESFNQLSTFDEIITFYNKHKVVCQEKDNENFFRDMFLESMKQAHIYAGKSMQNSLKLPTGKDNAFALFTHTTKYKDGLTKEQILEQWINPNKITDRNNQISLCYVTDKNPFFFTHNEKTDVVLGFLNIKPENIESIAPRNTFSMQEEFPRFPPILYSADTFAKISGSIGASARSDYHRHNEILYNKPVGEINGNEVLMPDCIVSRSEEITEYEQMYADAFNIPIVKINSLEYAQNIDKDFHKNYQTYKMGGYSIPNIKTK